MKQAAKKPLGAETPAEVSFRVQQNGPASSHEEDSLPFLPALMLQPLENDVTPLLHPDPHPDVALVYTLRAGAEEPMQRCPPLSWGSCKPSGHLSPFKHTYSGHILRPLWDMVDPSTCCREACGQSFTASIAWSQIPNGDRHWLGRGGVGSILGRGCFLLRELQQIPLAVSTCAFGK